jgi:hypothetical protein
MTFGGAIGLTWRRGFLATLLLCFAAVTARALPLEFVRMHVGDDPRWADPAFDDSRWPMRSLRDLDSQNRIIWLRTSPITRDIDGPLGVSISALGSYQVFWNGRPIGSSGVPGASREAERPGLVDSHFTVPSDLVTDRNVLAVRISTFHLPYRMAQPVQRLAVGNYDSSVSARIRDYFPALAATGLLLLGSVYFVTVYLLDRRRRDLLLASCLALTLLTQLALEVVRGFVSYRYDIHLLRVGSVFLLGAAFGTLLVAYAAHRFLEKGGGPLVWVSVTWALFCGLFFTGFDQKTAMAIVGSAVIASCALVPAAEKGDHRAFVGLAACAVLIVALAVDFTSFLNRDLYIVSAALLSAILVHHAILQRVQPRPLPADLPIAIDAGRLPILSAKGAELVELAQITAINGADDYAEITTVSGSKRLYRGRLADLATCLPNNFVRVHRSHFVNSNHIKELISVNGTLKIKVASDLFVPVSRSYAPVVRKLFSTADVDRLAPASAPP